jgi:transcriptional regulator
MYVPAAFRLEDQAAILAVMRENAFATLVSTVDGAPYASHIPLLVAVEGEQIVLRGHLARNNPHASHLAEGSALAIFSGPHAYVSPRYYVTAGQVPTWNYVSVHAYGMPRIIEGAAEVDDHLREMVLTFDANLESERPDSLAADVFERLRRALVVFEIRVDRLEAKAKMSQNKSPADREGVVAGLLSAGDPITAGWIRR